MGKATFEALLPIIEQQKEGKMLFYWYYQHNQLSGRFNYGQEEYQKSNATMLEIAQKKRLKVEEVVAQYKIALLMKEGQNRVFSMALVHQNLYQPQGRQ